MVTEIIVKVGGTAGLDETERLRADLAEEFGLRWTRERAPDGGHLGVSEFLLHAAVQLADGAPDAVIAAVAIDRARAVIKRWQERWLDPPEVEVSTREPGQDSDRAPDPKPGQAPDGPSAGDEGAPG